MEELRIKCPSCGIILDVRNSKNEAVKRITCPNCKKQLAVTFRDEPQPAQFVEMKMVQLADGSTKTIIKVLTSEHVIKVNGEQLVKDDEVVLSVGDELEIDGKISVFGNSQQAKHQPTVKTKSQPAQTFILPSKRSSNNYWIVYVVTFAIGVLIAYFGWKLSNSQQSSTTVEIVPSDTVALPTEEPVAKENSVSKLKPKQIQKQEKSTPPVKQNIASLSNYELEKLAMSGDVDAQCQLGKRWVSRHDSINVVKGIKYLKLAAQNGSSEARNALGKVYRALEQSSANGSRTAGNILREQR